MEQEHNLELTLFHPSSSLETTIGFFICAYCDRTFHSPQALGGHQNAHKYERSLAKHRREIAAAMRIHAGAMDAGRRPRDDRVVVATDNPWWQLGTKKPALVPDLLSNKGRSPEHGYGGVESAGELDLSLRL